MAEFCNKCAMELGFETSIYAGKDCVVWDLCECCGWGWFDEEGNRLLFEVNEREGENSHAGATD